MNFNCLKLFCWSAFIFSSVFIFPDDNFDKNAVIEDDKILSQTEIVILPSDEDRTPNTPNPFFRSKYYRKKNSLLDAQNKKSRLQRSYPTSRAYHPPIEEKDYLRQEQSDRRVQNRKNFLRFREKQLEKDYPELLEEIDSKDSRDFRKN